MNLQAICRHRYRLVILSPWGDAVMVLDWRYEREDPMSTPAFDPILAATRFGIGLSPVIAPPTSIDEMTELLAGPDRAARRIPIPGFDAIDPSMATWVDTARAERDARGTAGHEAAREAFREVRRGITRAQRDYHLRSLGRAATTTDGLRERLVDFWADHFTVKAKNRSFAHSILPFAQDAIRPYVAGRFEDMVVAVALHPVMLSYLDQANSIGPQSAVGLRSGRGLNENFARELLELHLLGVDADYSQVDVTELAELLTGLRYDRRNGFSFDKRRAEPGSEVVLGRRYPAEPSLNTVKSALRDLCRNRQVARHVAGKLAVHFVSDTPDPDLVETMTRVFVETRGNLLDVTRALLSHPAAWAPDRKKVRRPDLFVAASLRALGLDEGAILALDERTYRRWIAQPLTVMGQPLHSPVGPDGWSEDPADWITPQGLAGRITWALGAPEALMADLPDPRAFVTTALGPAAEQTVVFAANAAESRADGIGIVLTSPAFQRI